MDLVVVVDSRLWLPAQKLPRPLIQDLKQLFTHSNPDFHRKRAMGFKTWGTEATIRTVSEVNDPGFGKRWTLPRGGIQKLKALAAEYGFGLRWMDRRTSVPVEFPDFRVSAAHPEWVLRPYQADAVATAMRRQQGIIRAPTGCLCGSTVVGLNRAGKSFEMSISEVWLKSGGGKTWGRCWDPEIPTKIRAADSEGFIRLFDLTDVYESGIKPVYRVRTESGRSIDATLDHRFMTPFGWIPLSELDAGDFVSVDIGRIDKGKSQRKLHGRENWRNVTARTGYERIVGIDVLGDTPTFDIEVAEVGNFVANGFVVHNSGKTLAAMALIHELGQRTIVIMRDSNLLTQWREVAEECLNLSRREIGIVKGGRGYKPGARLTLALQQSLYSKGNRLNELLKTEPHGMVLIDEVQTLAARTFQKVIDRFPCKYRIGFSADETRKDKKEFLIYDMMGEVIYEIERSELEELGVIHEVVVRVCPTRFRADWYLNSEPQDRDFNRLISEMIDDEDRNRTVMTVIHKALQYGETPAVVFTHRREHAVDLADRQLFEAGISAGLLIGGARDAERFADDKKRLLDGKIRIAVGSFNALGVGHNFPAIRSGICTTPISKSNRQFFGQVRGRICRTSEGKNAAILYYVWDRHVFPDQLRTLWKWNSGRVEMWDGRDDKWVSGDFDTIQRVALQG